MSISEGAGLGLLDLSITVCTSRSSVRDYLAGFLLPTLATSHHEDDHATTGALLLVVQDRLKAQRCTEPSLESEPGEWFTSDARLWRLWPWENGPKWTQHRKNRLLRVEGGYVISKKPRDVCCA